MSDLPPWVKTKQAAAYLGLSTSQFMSKLYGGNLTGIDVRRIGSSPYLTDRHVYRIERASLLRLKRECCVAAEELPRWVKIKQAAEYYQISDRTVRAMIASGKLKAKRIGRQIRIDRESLLELGQVKYWGT